MKQVKFTKLILWVLTLALAYAIVNLIDTLPLAKAFFGLHAVTSGAMLVTLLIIFAFGKEVALNQFGKILIRILRFIVAMVITSIISYAASLFVTVDFFTAYLLLSLGQSMFNVEYVDGNGFAEIKEKFANVKLFSSKGSHSVNKFGKFGSWGKKDKDPENQMPDTEFVDAEYDETPEDFDGTIEGGEATSTFEEE